MKCGEHENTHMEEVHSLSHQKIQQGQWHYFHVNITFQHLSGQKLVPGKLEWEWGWGWGGESDQKMQPVLAHD